MSLQIPNNTRYFKPNNKDILKNKIPNETTWGDDVLNFFDDLAPNIAYEYAPKGYINSFANSNDVLINNEFAFECLPRNFDGSYDTKKIKDSLMKSKTLIFNENQEASSLMEYGIYKNAINDMDLLTALLGPEMAKVIVASDTENILPDFFKNGVSIFDLNPLQYLKDFVDNETLLEIMSESDIISSSDLEKDIEGLTKILDTAIVLSSTDIKENIEKQNKGLEELLNFEINNDEDAELFLEKYLELTGTSFLSNEIDECWEIYQDENSTEYEKNNAFKKSCGLSKNLVDAQKNQILTEIAYNTGIKYIVPKLINKIPNPITKIISSALPTYIDTMETLTQGTDDNTIVDFNNLDYDKLIEILSVNGANALIINLENLIPYDKSGGFSTFVKKVSSKLGLKSGATQFLKTASRGVVPNYSSWENFFITSLIPGSGLFIK